jgi:2-keto-4-pentenoate hydratase
MGAPASFPKNSTHMLPASAWILDARAHAKISPRLPSEMVPNSLEQALVVQKEVTQALGQTVAGWKVAVGPDGALLCAPIYRAVTFSSGTIFDLPSRPSRTLEVEAAFVLRQDLPVAACAEDVLSKISHVMIGAEIVQPRFTDTPASVHALLADNLANGAYVTGALVPFSSDCNLRDLRIEAFVDGHCFWKIAGTHPTGDPLTPLVKFAALGSKHLGGLRRGQFVTTGSLCGAPTPLSARSNVRISSALGYLAFEIGAKIGAGAS